LGRRVVVIESLVAIVVPDADGGGGGGGAAAADIGGGGDVALDREGAAAAVVPVTGVGAVDNPDNDEIWGFSICDCVTVDDGIGNMERDRRVELGSLSSVAFDFLGISSLPRLGMVVGI
jgi:hypothetical protein